MGLRACERGLRACQRGQGACKRSLRACQEAREGMNRRTDGCTDRRTDGWMDGISPHSTRLCPLLESLPCYSLKLQNIKEAGQVNR